MFTPQHSSRKLFSERSVLRNEQFQTPKQTRPQKEVVEAGNLIFTKNASDETFKDLLGDGHINAPYSLNKMFSPVFHKQSGNNQKPYELQDIQEPQESQEKTQEKAQEPQKAQEYQQFVEKQLEQLRAKFPFPGFILFSILF